MSFRSYLKQLDELGALARVSSSISKTYEIAGVLKQLEPRPVLFENVQGSAFRVAGNLFCSKADFADYFGIPVSGIIPTLQPGHRRSARPAAAGSAGALPGGGRSWSPTWTGCPSCATASRMAATTSARGW